MVLVYLLTACTLLLYFLSCSETEAPRCGRRWATFEDEENMTLDLCFWEMSRIINAQVLGGLRVAGRARAGMVLPIPLTTNSLLIMRLLW